MKHTHAHMNTCTNTKTHACTVIGKPEVGPDNTQVVEIRFSFVRRMEGKHTSASVLLVRTGNH